MDQLIREVVALINENDNLISKTDDVAEMIKKAHLINGTEFELIRIDNSSKANVFTDELAISLFIHRLIGPVFGTIIGFVFGNIFVYYNTNTTHMKGRDDYRFYHIDYETKNKLLTAMKANISIAGIVTNGIKGSDYGLIRLIPTKSSRN